MRPGKPDAAELDARMVLMRTTVMRHQRGIPADRAAARLGVTPEQFHELEHVPGLMSVAQVVALADLYRTSLGWLLNGRPDELRFVRPPAACRDPIATTVADMVSGLPRPSDKHAALEAVSAIYAAARKDIL